MKNIRNGKYIGKCKSSWKGFEINHNQLIIHEIFKSNYRKNTCPTPDRAGKKPKYGQVNSQEIRNGETEVTESIYCLTTRTSMDSKVHQ